MARTEAQKKKKAEAQRAARKAKQQARGPITGGSRGTWTGQENVAAMVMSREISGVPVGSGPSPVPSLKAIKAYCKRKNLKADTQSLIKLPGAGGPGRTPTAMWLHLLEMTARLVSVRTKHALLLFLSPKRYSTYGPSLHPPPPPSPVSLPSHPMKDTGRDKNTLLSKGAKKYHAAAGHKPGKTFVCREYCSPLLAAMRVISHPSPAHNTSFHFQPSATRRGP
jgi:hypothetical protein